MPSQTAAVRAALHYACAALVAAALSICAAPGRAADTSSAKDGTMAVQNATTPAVPKAPAASGEPTAADEPAAPDEAAAPGKPAATGAPAADASEGSAPDSSGKSAGSRRHRRGSGHASVGIEDHINIDDFDSFGRAMDMAPWIVGVIFLVLGSIFLTPIIVLVGIIWYKLRKTRLQNEAVIKLAEKGVMPSAQAVDAVVAGTAPAQATATEAAVQQVVASRRRAVWSDLRKGLIMLAIGFALSLYSITSDQTANWIGLVLIFVGLAFVALWWLEDRHLQQRAGNMTGDGKV